MTFKMEFSTLSAKKAMSDTIWSGEAMGRKALPLLMSQAKKLEGSFWVVDLQGIEVVTASAFRSSLRALREYNATSFHAPTVYANATEEVIEEAAFVAEKYGEAYLFGQLKSSGEISAIQIVGSLDITLRSTLRLLQDQGESDAKQLFTIAGSPGVTAWHNRLAELEQRGLVISRSVGRSRKYTAIAQEAIHGD